MYQATLTQPSPSTITFDSGTNPKWEADMAATITLLCRNGYVVQVYYEDAGIWVVEFDYKDPNLANVVPVWVDPIHQQVVDVNVEEE